MMARSIARRRLRSWLRKAGIDWERCGPGPGILQAFDLILASSRRDQLRAHLEEVFGASYSGKAWRDVFGIWILVRNDPSILDRVEGERIRWLLFEGAPAEAFDVPDDPPLAFSFRWAWSLNTARQLYGKYPASWRWLQVYARHPLRCGFKGQPVIPHGSAADDLSEVLTYSAASYS